jgi:hypothetical protein
LGARLARQRRVAYIVIDKIGAELFVFDSQGQLIGRAPVLLGSAKGDDSVPGVGDRELAHNSAG